MEMQINWVKHICAHCTINNSTYKTNATYLLFSKQSISIPELYIYRDNDDSITVWIYSHSGPPSRPAQDESALTDNQQTCSINKKLESKIEKEFLNIYRIEQNFGGEKTFFSPIFPMKRVVMQFVS